MIWPEKTPDAWLGKSGKMTGIPLLYVKIKGLEKRMDIIFCFHENAKMRTKNNNKNAF